MDLVEAAQTIRDGLRITLVRGGCKHERTAGREPRLQARFATMQQPDQQLPAAQRRGFQIGLHALDQNVGAQQRAVETDDERPAAVRHDGRVAHDCGTITNSW
ncbi:hypothetical protein OKW38_000811 [Paraburkholderia sp. MM5496-R1]